MRELNMSYGGEAEEVQHKNKHTNKQRKGKDT